MAASSRRPLAGIDAEIWSICTGTDSTLSNMTGPGRIVGKWITKGGRRIETLVGSLAHRLGYGPTAVVIQMLSLVPELVACSTHTNKHAYWNLSRFRDDPTANNLFDYLAAFSCPACRASFSGTIVRDPKFEELARRLLGFLTRAEISAQLIAINYISLFVSFHHIFRDYWRNAIVVLHSVRRDPTANMAVRDAALEALKWLEEDETYHIFEASLESVRQYSGEQSLDLEQLFIMMSALRSLAFPDNGIQTYSQPLVVQLYCNVVQDLLKPESLRYIPIARFPSRDLIATILHRFRYSASSELLERRILKDVLEGLVRWVHLNYYHHDVPAERSCRAAADLYIPILHHRISEGKYRSDFAFIYTIPDIYLAHKTALVAEGRTLLKDMGIKLPRGDVAGKLNGVIKAAVLETPPTLPPPVISWIERVIEALDAPCPRASDSELSSHYSSDSSSDDEKFWERRYERMGETSEGRMSSWKRLSRKARARRPGKIPMIVERPEEEDDD